jgi:hypothetical protein
MAEHDTTIIEIRERERDAALERAARLEGLLRMANTVLAEIGCIAPAGEAAVGVRCYACRARDEITAALTP